MATRISGFPTALLALVGSQNFGVAPKELGELVTPTLDMTPLYLLGQQTTVSITLSAPANGGNQAQGLSIPQGENWYIHNVGLQVLAGAGVTGEFSLYWTAMPGNGFSPIADTVVMTASTFRMKAGGGGFWMRSGSEISCHIANLVGVPTVSIAGVVTRLRS